MHNTMFAKQDAKGQFKEIGDAGRSLTADRRPNSEADCEVAHGDLGDRPRAAVKRQ
jgi:hypothetical protein